MKNIHRYILVGLFIVALLISGCGNSKINECVKACAKDKYDIGIHRSHWTQVCSDTEWQKGEVGLDRLIHYCKTGEKLDK